MLRPLIFLVGCALGFLSVFARGIARRRALAPDFGPRPQDTIH